MTIMITNYCDMGCLHCMQKSTTSGKHMDEEVFKKSLAFAKHSPRLTTLQISGGEPTSHPNFLKLMEETLETFPDIPVTLITNGEYVRQGKYIEELDALMEKFEYFLIQITSVPMLYKKHLVSKEVIPEYINASELRKKRVLFATDLPFGLIPMGRAKENREKLEKGMGFDFAKRRSTSCFNMYSSLKGNDGKLFEAIDYIKTHSMATLCKPLITENGDVVFGEYHDCSKIISLKDFDIGTIKNFSNVKLELNEVPGPCGQCVNTQSQINLVKEHLNIFNFDASEIDVIAPQDKSLWDEEETPISTFKAAMQRAKNRRK